MEDCVKEVSDVNWKEYFPLIGPCIVILLFALERVLSYKIRKREIERTWYFKVLIDPSLSKMNDFFSDVQKVYLEASSSLSGSKTLPHTEFTSLKSTKIGEFQKVKRIFDTDIIPPINKRYPTVGSKLQNILLDLEDCFSSSIDAELFSDDDVSVFHEKVCEMRAIWLNILYEPIR